MTDTTSKVNRDQATKTKRRLVWAVSIAVALCLSVVVATSRHFSRSRSLPIRQASSWAELDNACRAWQDQFRYKVTLKSILGALRRGKLGSFRRPVPEGEVQRQSLESMKNEKALLRYVLWLNIPHKDTNKVRAKVFRELPDGSLADALDMLEWGDNPALEKLHNHWESYFAKRYRPPEKNNYRNRWYGPKPMDEYENFAQELVESFLDHWEKYDTSGQAEFVEFLIDTIRKGDLWRRLPAELRTEMFAKAVSLLPEPGVSSAAAKLAPEVHLALLGLLVYERNPERFPYYADYIENYAPNPSDRRTAVYGAFNIDAPEELAVPFWCKALRNPDWRKSHLMIIEQARCLRSSEILEPLLQFVSYDNYRLWGAAARSLIWWKDTEFKKIYAALPREKQFQIQLILYQREWQNDEVFGAPFLATDAPFVAKTLDSAHLDDAHPNDFSPIKQALRLARNRPYRDPCVMQAVMKLGQAIVDAKEVSRHHATFDEIVVCLENISGQPFRQVVSENSADEPPRLTQEEGEVIWKRIQIWWTANQGELAPGEL